jgi:hypothetical protein
MKYDEIWDDDADKVLKKAENCIFVCLKKMWLWNEKLAMILLEFLINTLFLLDVCYFVLAADRCSRLVSVFSCVCSAFGRLAATLLALLWIYIYGHFDRRILDCGCWRTDWLRGRAWYCGCYGKLDTVHLWHTSIEWLDIFVETFLGIIRQGCSDIYVCWQKNDCIWNQNLAMILSEFLINN